MTNLREENIRQSRVLTEGVYKPLIITVECPWCHKKHKKKEYNSYISGNHGTYSLCFKRGTNGENISPCAILYERSEDEELTKKKLCIPKSMHSYSLDNFYRTDVADKCRELTNIKPSMVLITGTNAGIGKTYLSVSMLIDFAKRYPLSAKFKTFYNIMRDVKLAIEGEGDKSVEAIVKEISSIGILCIDDIGAGKTTEYQTDILYQIINERMENGKITIVTTNHSGKELHDKYGGRIQSRLGSDQVIVLKSKDDQRIKKSTVWEFDV